MEGSKWLRRKPETNMDWLGMIFASIVFYVVLTNAGLVLDILSSVTGVLSPFAAGVVIAYVINPVVNWSFKYICRSKPKLHWLAMLLGYIVAFAMVGALAYLMVSQVLASLADFVGKLDVYAQNLIDDVLKLDAEHQWGLTEWLGDTQTLLSNTDLIQEWLNTNLGIEFSLSNTLREIATALGKGAYDTVWSLAKGLVAGLTALASSVYLLIAKEKLLRHAKILTRAFLPRRVSRTVLRICHDANRNLTGFFTGKILDSAIIGVLTFVSMKVLQLDYAAMISVIVGITNIIPVFGPFIGAIPGILILLLADPMQSLKFAILILAIQQLDGNFIGPKILGDSIGISALWVLFAIVVGNALFGLVGMVVGVPVFATLYSLVKEFAEWCLRRRGIDKDGNPLGEGGQTPQPAEAVAAEEPKPTMVEKVRQTISRQRAKQKQNRRARK